MSSGLDSKVDVKGDGSVVLYKKHWLKNPKWIARLKVTGAKGYKTFSTKTTDQREAERIALDAYEEAYFRVKGGGLLNAKTFGDVFEEWKKSFHLLAANRQGGGWEDTAKRVEDYALVYFGDTMIDRINSASFQDYWIWRKSNYRKKLPSDNTLRREKTSIRPVFNYALSKGYITDLPTIPAPKEEKVRRPTFTLNEWRKLTRQMREWVRDAEGTAGYRSRFYAWNYFLTLANTGLRVGEARDLTWGVLRSVDTDDGKRLLGEVSGKTGFREFVFQAGAEDYIKRIYDYREDELGHKPSLDEPIFCHSTGKTIQTYKKAFINLLEFAGISRLKRGQQLTIYSLRHFYATQRLTNEANPFLLAKQMGTSVDMIERYYGQTMSADVASQVTKSSTRAKGRAERAYPFE